MGATYTRQSSYTDGDVITAAHTNSEFDQLLAVFQASSGHVHDGTDNEGGVIADLIGNAITIGSKTVGSTTFGTLNSDTTLTFNSSDTNSGVLSWDTSADLFQFSDDILIIDNEQLIFGSDSNVAISYDETTTDSLKIAATEGAGLAITLMADEGDDAGDEWKLNIADGGTLTLGNDIASAGSYVTHLTLTPNSTVASSTLAVAGNLTVGGSFTLGSGAVLSEAELEMLDGITAGTVAASKAMVVDANRDIGTVRNLTIDGTFSDGNYTFDTSGNVSGLGTVASGAITSSGIVTGTGFTAGSAVLAEAELELLDGLTAGTAIASKVVTTDASINTTGQNNLTISGELDAATGDFSSNVDIAGDLTLSAGADGALRFSAASSIKILDNSAASLVIEEADNAYMTFVTTNSSEAIKFDKALDINGAVQIDATFTSGVDGQGYDTKFFGDTSSAFMLWDTSADDLIFSGAAGLVVPDGQLVLGSTAVSSTATELNLLDGVSGLVQADFTKLAAVDSTAAELNIVDGDTSATATTLADADRVVVNDNGTMVQVALTDFETYFESALDTLSNVTTVGTLNSGVISSGFGNIDIGSSNLTATGTISLGATSFNDNAITNVGDIALDSISADGTNINVAVSDNSGTAFTIKQGSNAYLIVDTGNSSESVSIGTGISGTAITLGHSTSEVTVADNLTVTGDLTVSGTTTTVDTTNTVVKDNLLGLNNGASSNSNDSGIIVERGSTGNDALLIWDESADKWALGTTTSNASSTGNLNMTTGTLVANIEGNVTGNVTGNTSGTAATVTGAAQSSITSLGTLTTLSVDNITINGNDISSTAGTDLTITPLSGQQIVLDGTIVVDAGVVTGATSITSTAFVGDITGDVTGNADTATALATGRTIGMTGDVVWTSASFTGAGNVTGSATIQAGAVENSMLADDAVGADELAANAVVNASVASNAAIAFSKMANLTTGRALVSDGSGDVSVSAVTATEIGHLDGVTSAIQTQIDAKTTATAAANEATALAIALG